MSADEFDIIAKYFAPLATDPGARGLVDDAAVLEAKGRLVVTTDAIVERTHFLPRDPLDTVAKKALRVNFSDLAAKGARPAAVVLSLVWPRERPAEQIADFARGLGEDLREFGVTLFGGDTTATDGPLVVSVTAFGEPLGPRTPARADARAGEQVWVTGVIGDAWLGLRQLTATPDLIGAAPDDQVGAEAARLRQLYRVPEPPLAFAEPVARLATAAMDVSDGLLGDAEKIAAASGVALRIDAEAVPLSASGHAYVEAHAGGLADLVGGGDDYQILFTAPPEARAAILAAARERDVAVALIGDVEAGAGVRIAGPGVQILPRGYRHRLGR